MSKVKNYYWDEAEKYIDQLISKIKDGTLTIADAVKEGHAANVAWDLVGIHSQDDLEECLTIESDL